MRNYCKLIVIFGIWEPQGVSIHTAKMIFYQIIHMFNTIQSLWTGWLFVVWYIYIYIYIIYTIYIHILYICTLLKKYLKGEMLCLHIGFTTFIFYTISSYHHSKIFMSYYHDSMKRHHNGSPHDRFLGVVSLNITSSCTLHLFNLVFIKRNRFTFTESFLVLVNMNIKSDISRQIFSHWLHVLLLQYYLMTRRNFRCPSNSLQQDVKNEQVLIDSVVLSMEIWYQTIYKQ